MKIMDFGNRRNVVRTREGIAGRIEPITGEEGRALVRFDDGRTLVVSTDLLEPQPDGAFLLRLPGNAIQAPGREDYAVIPVLREELEVGKRMVETDRGVRIHKQVTERSEEVVQLLYREDLDVQHVPRNELVDEAPAVRYEGTTMVVPLCEEVLVIQKRLLLKEEVRVTRRERQMRHAETVVLRSEQATVERFGEGPDRTTASNEAGPISARTGIKRQP